MKLVPTKLVSTHAVAASVLALLAVLLAAPAARAQVETREGIFLQNQIQELKRDIAILRDQMARGGSSLGGARPAPGPVVAGDVTAALLDRVARLEDEVRQLRGQVDEAANAQRRMGEDLGKRIEDLNFKLDNGAVRPGAPAVPGGAGVTAPVPAAPVAPRRTAEVALQEGNAALARRDYLAAEAAAREVLALNKSPRAVDAQFLLAQAMAGKRDWQGAAVAFDDTYNRARTGSHAPDSLLGLANALTAIGEKRAACATLDKLRAEFPTLRGDLREPAVAARTRAGCR